MVATQKLEINILKKNQIYEINFRNHKNEMGILYKLTAIFFVHGWNILKADVNTSQNGTIEDSFIVEPTFRLNFTKEYLNRFNDEFELLLNEKISVVEFLAQNEQALNRLKRLRESKFLTELTVENIPEIKMTLISIRSTDRPGLLFELSQIMYILGLDILQFKATYDDDGINDKIYVRSNHTQNCLEKGEMKELKRLFLEIFNLN